MALRYRALLLSNWEYTKLPVLNGPRNDVPVLRKALTDPTFGLFADSDLVVEKANLQSQQIATTIENFLTESKNDDYLLIYYSGHGGLRSDNYLALCGVDTESFDSTAFDTRQLPDWIKDKARDRPTILVLDCCFAGQVGGAPTKGGAVATSLSDANIPAGLLVLTSGGRTPSPDAETIEEPSPFTAALASILLDPEVHGDPEGYLSGLRVHEELWSRLPASKPRWKGGGGSGFRLARRPRPPGADDMPGWRDDLQMDVLDVTFTSEGVGGSWNANQPPERLERFDEQRRWAIRRLTQLVDGVIRQRDVDFESVDAVRRAWQCIGDNLFDSVLPKALQERVSSRPNGGLLKLRLSFDDPALEDYPWEYLREPHAAHANAGDSDAHQRIFGNAPSILVERTVPPAPPSGTIRVWDLMVINAYRDELGRTGDRVHSQLRSLFEPKRVRYLPGDEATWINVSDTLEQDPRFLVLIAPLMRKRDDPSQQKSVSIGFSRYGGGTDWHRTRAFVDRLVEKARVFECIVVVTYAADPGRDSYRAALALSSELARKGRGPVAFVCHERSYQDYLDREPERTPTLPGLLIQALQMGKPLDRAFAWARNRIIFLAGDSASSSFGVPGLYAPGQEEPARVRMPGPSPSASSMSTLGAPPKSTGTP